MNKQKHKKGTGRSCHEAGGWIQIKSSEVGRKAAKPRRLLRSVLKGSEEAFHGSSWRSQPRYKGTAL